jgi:GNAT superfamily N-acetyltransferase
VGDEATDGVEVRVVALDDPVAAALVQAQRTELAERYDEPMRAVGRPLDPADFAPPRGAFVVAWWRGEPVACGGVRPGHEPGVAELKRMFTAEAARRHGLGAVVLGALEAEARRLGYRAAQLETGVRQPDAVGFYESSGYVRTANYGRYAGRADSVCYRKDLAT